MVSLRKTLSENMVTERLQCVKGIKEQVRVQAGLSRHAAFLFKAVIVLKWLLSLPKCPALGFSVVHSYTLLFYSELLSAPRLNQTLPVYTKY